MTRLRNSVALILAACVWPATPAAADVITYTLSTLLRSSLTISGTYDGNPLQPQTGVPDSLVASYTGTITAIRDFTGDTLQITGGTIAAQNNDELGFGTNYGFIGSTATFGGAIINFSLVASSPTINDPSDFDVSQLSVAIGSGEIDYFSRVGGGGGALGAGGTGDILPITGAVSLVSVHGTLIDVDGEEMLSIPIEAQSPLNLISADGTSFPLDVNFSGNIVAMSHVPEPGSLAMLVIPAALLALHKL